MVQSVDSDSDTNFQAYIQHIKGMAEPVDIDPTDHMEWERKMIIGIITRLLRLRQD